jgi:hypothetical protein
MFKEPAPLLTFEIVTVSPDTLALMPVPVSVMGIFIALVWPSFIDSSFVTLVPAGNLNEIFADFAAEVNPVISGGTDTDVIFPAAAVAAASAVAAGVPLVGGLPELTGGWAIFSFNSCVPPPLCLRRYTFRLDLFARFRVDLLDLRGKAIYIYTLDKKNGYRSKKISCNARARPYCSLPSIYRLKWGA